MSQPLGRKKAAGGRGWGNGEGGTYNEHTKGGKSHKSQKASASGLRRGAADCGRRRRGGARGRGTRDNVLYFYSPSDVAAKHVAAGVDFRIGGLVKRAAWSGPEGPGAFRRDRRQAPCRSPMTACFPICSAKGRASWRWARWRRDGMFNASQILAKHDEKYMPPEVVDALKRSGHWKEGGSEGSMTGELGQFALCLALSLAGDGGRRTLRRAERRARARAVAISSAFGLFVFVAWLRHADLRLRQSDFRIVDVARIRTRSSRWSTRSAACGETTKARCCSGCWCWHLCGTDDAR